MLNQLYCQARSSRLTQVIQLLELPYKIYLELENYHSYAYLSEKHQDLSGCQKQILAADEIRPKLVWISLIEVLLVVLQTLDWSLAEWESCYCDLGEGLSAVSCQSLLTDADRTLTEH